MTDSTSFPSGAPLSSGAAPGFRPGRTLSVRTELRRQLARLRTKVMYGFCALLPILLIGAFTLADADAGQGADLIGLATHGGLNFAVFTLVMSVGFVLVVVVALCFGDTVASEASWSSLKYLLAMPIPRGRLLAVKAVVATVLSSGAIAVLLITAFVLGGIAYGWAPLTSPFGDVIDTSTAIGRLAIGLAFIVISLAWVAGLAMLLSVATNAPLGAVGGAGMTSIVCQILDQITALGSIREWLPNHFTTQWTTVIDPSINWDPLLAGTQNSLLYFIVFFTAAVIVFGRRDITS